MTDTTIIDLKLLIDVLSLNSGGTQRIYPAAHERAAATRLEKAGLLEQVGDGYLPTDEARDRLARMLSILQES